MTLGVVTGMASEARRFGGVAEIDARPSGGRRERTMVIARDLAGADRLMSFGLAGGLDPQLQPGDLVVADRIIAPDGTEYETDRLWREDVVSAIRGVVPFRVGPILGVEAAVTGAEDKARLLERTGAAAVDMESDLVARAARDAGRPFIALRAVADPASQAIPAFALAGLDESGRTRPGPVLSGLLRRPSALGSLLALARASARAHRTLDKIAPLVAMAA